MHVIDVLDDRMVLGCGVVIGAGVVKCGVTSELQLL